MNLSRDNIKSEVISDLKDIEYLFHHDAQIDEDNLPNIELI
tara:strand:+ start:98 stop:220 length:123 start_codon:yes stop_codon:yes gene_type:complete